VANWEDEKLLLDYLWHEKLKIDPTDHLVSIAEAPLSKLDDRKLVLEIFYETFGFEALQIAPQSLLALYAQGLVTGIVVDSGDDVTTVTPVFENYLLAELITRTKIAGRRLTENLITLLKTRGCHIARPSDSDAFRKMKEELCFVSADIAMDRNIANETTCYNARCTLPSGRVVTVGSERFEAPELLFHPSKIGFTDKGMSDLVFDSIMGAAINLRKKFFEQIVLCGGTTMLPGFSTRLTGDLKKLFLTNILKGKTDRLRDCKIDIEDPPGRRFLVYEGLTVLANQSKGHASAWAWKQQYREFGADAMAKSWQVVMDQ
jgi:actin-related protein 2